MAAQMPDELDFAFADGDHSWEGINIDWTLVSEKVHSEEWFACTIVSLLPEKIGGTWIPACTLKR